MADDNQDLHVWFLLLNDANYMQWAMWMEAELIEKGLWGQVFLVLDTAGKSDDEIKGEWVKAVAKRSAKKMSEARATMVKRVETLQLVHMCEWDPMIIWDKLMAAYQVCRLATQLAKCCKFLMVAKMADELITVWASCVKGVAFDLEDIGGTVTDEDIIVVLTMGLGKEYVHFVASIDAMATQELTVDYVVTRMLNEEVWHGGKGSLYMNEALVVSVAKTKLWVETDRRAGVRKY